MKDIITKINESTKDGNLYGETIKIIDALKDWHDFAVKGNSKELKSDYIKEFEAGIEKFIRESVIVMDYVDGVITQVIAAYDLDIDPESDWNKIQDAFVKYIIEK